MPDATSAGSKAVVLRRQSGNELGSYGIGVPPAPTIQVVNVAATCGVVGNLDLFTIRLDTNDNDVTAYASMIDDRTGDPVLFTPSIIKGTKAYLVGVAHAFAEQLGVAVQRDLCSTVPAGCPRSGSSFLPDVPSGSTPPHDPAPPGAAKSFGDILTLVTDENTNC